MQFGTTAAASYVVSSATKIIAVAPVETAGTVDITVTTPDGTSATSPADQYSFAGVPAVSGVSPAGGLPAGGTPVIVTGTYFTGATAVWFGTTAAGTFTITSATRITVSSPSETAGTVDVTITAPSGTSGTSPADRFIYESAPVVTAVTPTSGYTTGGTSVSITGANFNAATAVSFGAGAATSFTVSSATSITAAISPAEAQGTVDITVTTPAGTSATSSADQFMFKVWPTVTAVSPTAGVPGRGHLGHHHRHRVHRRLGRQVRHGGRDRPGCQLGHLHHCDGAGRERRHGRRNGDDARRTSVANPPGRPVHL